MSKVALDMYTKCDSLELAPNGVRINSIDPGVIETPISKTVGVERADLQEFLESENELYPVGRIGVVADTTNAILFLANEKSSFIDGINLVVDGAKLFI